jgi:glutathione S-transferase
MKAEMLLKLAGLPYRTDTGGFKKAPKGKLPYIQDAGVVVPDSTFIRWHLEKQHGIDFDHALTPTERAVAWSVERLLEDHLYWAAVNERWCDDDNFAKGPARFFRSIPWLLRGFIVRMVRRKIASNLKGHGLGRHSQQEIAALAAKGIEAIATILGDKPYLMGAQPCGADATMFAFTAGLLCPLNPRLRAVAVTHPNLVAYSERMMRQYYPGLVKG